MILETLNLNLMPKLSVITIHKSDLCKFSTYTCVKKN